MIPPFQKNGNLPPGIFVTDWNEFLDRYAHTEHRRWLIEGLRVALKDLAYAGCKNVFIDGSFITIKKEPGDYDLCWSIDDVNPEKLNPVLLDFSPKGRAAMKVKYKGDLFPAEVPEGLTGKTFLDFFQTDKETGKPKGIVVLEVGGAL